MIFAALLSVVPLLAAAAPLTPRDTYTGANIVSTADGKCLAAGSSSAGACVETVDCNNPGGFSITWDFQAGGPIYIAGTQLYVAEGDNGAAVIRETTPDTSATEWQYNLNEGSGTIFTSDPNLAIVGLTEEPNGLSIQRLAYPGDGTQKWIVGEGMPQ